MGKGSAYPLVSPLDSDTVTVTRGGGTYRAKLGELLGKPAGLDGTGAVLDTTALQTLLDGADELTFVRSWTCLSSGFNFTNRAFFGGGTVIKASVDGATLATSSPAGWWAAADDDELHALEDLTLDGNGKRNVTGIHATGTLNLLVNRVRIRGVTKGARLYDTIFSDVQNLSVSGNLDFGVSVKNNATYGGNILNDIRRLDVRSTAEFATAWAASTSYAAGARVKNGGGRIYEATTGGISAASGGPTGMGSSISDGSGGLVWKYIAPGFGAIFENQSANDSLGSGSNGVRLSANNCGGPGLVVVGRTGGGRLEMEVDAYVEDCGIRGSADYPVTQDGVTVPSRCSVYVADNVEIKLSGDFLPHVNQADGYTVLLGENAKVLLAPRSLSVGAPGVAPVSVPDSSVCIIDGPFPAQGRNFRNVNFTRAIPKSFNASGGFSAWGRKSGIEVIPVAQFANELVALGGNPWQPDFAMVGSPAPSKDTDYIDAKLGLCTRITFANVAGEFTPSQTNMAALTVFPANGVAGENYLLRILVRVLAGSHQLEFKLPYEFVESYCVATVTTAVQEIFLGGKYGSHVDGSNFLGIRPTTTSAPDICVTAMTVMKSTIPEDLAQVFKGYVTPR